MAVTVNTGAPADLLGVVTAGDCLSTLARLPAGSVDTAFLDPPYNFGVAYANHDDSMPELDYLEWCGRWLGEAARVLKPTGHLWLLISDEHQAELKVLAEGEHGLLVGCDEVSSGRIVSRGNGRMYMKHHVIWYYSFGVNASKKMTRSHAHLLHLVKHPTKHTWHADAVRVPSARQLVYNDRRANPAGRLPDDTWILRSQDLPAGAADGATDVWCDHRIAGTHAARAGTPNQVPEAIVERALRFSTDPGDVVLDFFAGSGTTPTVAKKLGRRFVAVDNDPAVAALASARAAAAVEGSLLGPISIETGG